MDSTRFDRIATLFAQRRLSRRNAVQQGAVAPAQEATPVPAADQPDKVVCPPDET